MGSFSDFTIDIGWVTITSLGFAFDGLSSNIVILILSAEGISTRVFNASSLVL